MKKILLVTDGFSHPPVFARRMLRKTLRELDGCQFEHFRSLEELPVDLTSYAAIVVYVHHRKLSESALAKLDSFVTAGGGLLGIHSATASFKQVPHYFKILGGRFIGHGPVEKFEITPVGREDVFSDIPAFEVVDELYLHEFQSDVEVHFSINKEGVDVPAVWTSTFGNGRVCYAMPGHRTLTLKNKTYQELLKQGLKWVAQV